MGHEPSRWGEREALQVMVAELDLPTAVLHRGKGVVDESHRRFLGVYAGEVGSAAAHHAVRNADIVIAVGELFTGGLIPFTHDLSPERLITVHPQQTVVAGSRHPMSMTAALSLLKDVLQRVPHRAPSRAANQVSRRPHDEGPLTQSALWRIVEKHLRPGDIFSAEAGTAYYGALGVRLATGVEMVSQGLWSSIGYTLPAILGANVAAPDRRPILVIGDGSLQLTAQELGTIIRLGLSPVVIVLNNEGYTVERAIHGATAQYNDVAQWNWQLLPSALGATDPLVCRVTTPAELEASLQEARKQPRRLAFIEAILPRLDVPALLREVAERVSHRNGFTAAPPDLEAALGLPAQITV
jgi:alpha-keto-acid decarboxylase